MAASNQVYDVIESDALSDSNSTIGAFGFNYNNGKAYMVLSKDSNLGLFAHELKHDYQFETGETGSVTREQDEEGVSFLHDKTDEVIGYQGGKLFEQNDSYSTGSLPDIYKNLPTGPINTINHP